MNNANNNTAATNAAPNSGTAATAAAGVTNDEDVSNSVGFDFLF